MYNYSFSVCKFLHLHSSWVITKLSCKYLFMSCWLLTCHGVLPGCVFTLVTVVTGIATGLIVCLRLLQPHHLSGGSRGARYVATHTYTHIQGPYLTLRHLRYQHMFGFTATERTFEHFLSISCLTLFFTCTFLTQMHFQRAKHWVISAPSHLLYFYLCRFTCI